MVDVKLRKANKKIEDLTERLSQASMGILNMRQMYEGATQEKLVLQSQLQNIQNMLTALVSQGRGKSVRIRPKSLENVGKFAGLDTKVDAGDGLVITALTIEQVQEMQDDIEEELEE